MKRGMRAGMVAGAVGTLALDVTSYGDMALRGRPASELPGKAAAQLLSRAGVDIGPEDEEATAHRAGAVGALLGYASGVGIGGAYGLVRRRRRPAGRRAGIGLGVAAMALTNGPMVLQGLTDPRTWGVAGWVSDIVPHVAYGLGTALAYEGLAPR